MDGEKPPNAEDEKTPDAGSTRSKRVRKANMIYSGDDYDLPKSPASGPKTPAPKASTPKPSTSKTQTPKTPSKVTNVADAKDVNGTKDVKETKDTKDTKETKDVNEGKEIKPTSTKPASGSVVISRIKKGTADTDTSKKTSDNSGNESGEQMAKTSVSEATKSTASLTKATGKKVEDGKSAQEKTAEIAPAASDSSPDPPNAPANGADTPATPKATKPSKSKKKATPSIDLEKNPFASIGGPQSAELLVFLSKKKQDISEALTKYEQDLRELNSQLNSAIKASSGATYPVLPAQPIFPSFVPPSPASFMGLGALGSPLSQGSLASNYMLLSNSKASPQFDRGVQNLMEARAAANLHREIDDELSDDSMDEEGAHNKEEGEGGVDGEDVAEVDGEGYVESATVKKDVAPRVPNIGAYERRPESYQAPTKAPSAMRLLESLPKKYRRDDGSEAYRFAKAVMKRLMNHKCAMPFNQPVDPVKLNLPDYFTVIKEPMDFSTINDKLNQFIYNTLDEFIKDVRLVFHNCESYNHPGSGIVKMSGVLKGLFESKLLNRPADSKMTLAQSEDDIISRLYQPPPEPKSKLNPIKQYSEKDKQKLADMINTLPEEGQRQVLEILRSNITVGQEQEEIEIDIDILDNVALMKLESFLRKFKRKQSAMNANKSNSGRKAASVASE